MSCKSCFTDYICHCIPYNDFIKINTALTPASTYNWIITDKFENQYSGSVVAENDGTLEIPIAGLPDGLLTQFGGTFKIEIQDDECSSLKIPIAKKYDCIEIEVKGGSREKNEIGCAIQCNQVAGTSLLIPFTDQSTVSIDWTLYDDIYGNNPVVQVYHNTGGNNNELVTVEITQVRENGVLTEINIDNGGIATGYVLIS